MPLKDFVGKYDITDNDLLIRYAAKTQVCLMVSGAVPDAGMIPQGDIAAAVDMTPGNFSTPLNSTRKPLTHDYLSSLDAATVSLAPKLSDTGGLVAFAARMRGMYGRRDERRRGMQAWYNVAHVPPIWTRQLLEEHPDQPVAVLLQASVLLAVFHGAQGGAHRVRELFRGQLTRVVDRLILIGISAPTPQSVEAIILLGSLAHYAFPVVRERLQRHLHNTPLGFRVWRIITSIVHASKHADSGLPVDEIKDWVYLQLEDCNTLRQRSIYPARSLDLELAIAIPAAWTRGAEDWPTKVLWDRANSAEASVRERGTAALGLWERALERGTADLGRRYLTTLVKEWSAERIDTFDSVRSGRKWVAETIMAVIESGDKVCNEFPDSAEPCLAAVRRAAQTLSAPSVPPAVLNATRWLFEHAVLQNAGVYRRRAIDTLRAAGLARPVAEAFGRLLDDSNSDADPWLRCRVLFAIGFLQERGVGVQVVLRQAYERARADLVAAMDRDSVTRDLVSEVHAALFAVGDCFGAPGSENEAREMRRALDPTAQSLVTRCTDERFFPIPRAAVYVVTVTAKADDQVLLDLLATHQDTITADASRWARAARFDGHDNLRPLHAAAADSNGNALQ